MLIRYVLLLALTQLPVAFAGELWVANQSHRVLRNEPASPDASIFDGKTGTVRLFAARNEFISFQVVFPGEMKSVNVEEFSLSGPNGAKLEHVELFREHFVPCPVVSQYNAQERPWDVVAFEKRRAELGAPREFPVQMVPLSAPKHGAPFDVAANTNEVVWVEIFVPEESPPGEYSAAFKAGSQTLTIKLTVWDFTLPSVSHFPHFAYIGPDHVAWAFGKSTEQLASIPKVWDGYFQTAHNHRLVISEGFCYSLAYIKQPDRRFYEYARGDAFKGPFGKGIGQEIIWIDWNGFEKFAGLIKEEKWLNRAFVMLGDEPHSKETYEEVIRKGAAVKQSAPFLQTFITEQYTPTKPDWPALDPAVDIFCSGAIPPESIREIESKGKVVWTYNGGHAGSPYIDAPGPAVRSHAWCGYVSGARSWFFWDAGYVVDKQNRWKNERRNIDRDPARYLHDLWNDGCNFDQAKRPKYKAVDAMRLNGDGLLLYPGTEAGLEAPLSCLRLKQVRLGAQDYEYLYLLEQMDKQSAALDEARLLIGSLRASGTSADGQAAKDRYSYELDPSKWEAARIRLGKLLDSIGERAIRAKVTPWNSFPNPVGHRDFFDGKRH